MSHYPPTPEELRRQLRTAASEQLLLRAFVEGQVNRFNGSGEIALTTQRVLYRPGSLDKLTLKAGKLTSDWPLEEIVRIEARRGRPVLFSISAFFTTIFEVLVILPIITVCTLGIGGLIWCADRVAGPHLIVETENDRAWFFVKNTKMADLDHALSLLFAETDR